MREQPTLPLAFEPNIGLLQDVTYRPFAEYLCNVVEELPRDMALDTIARMLRGFHALPLDVEPRLEVHGLT